MFFHSRLLTGSFKRDTITWRGTTMQKQTNEIDFREEKEGLFMERQTVQIFWTGGMDSTLRIVQLSQLEVNVLPVYIMRANGRKTAVEELTAMGKIYEILKADPRTKATLLPFRLVADSEDEIPDAIRQQQIPYTYYHRKRYGETVVRLKRAQKKVFALQANRAPGIRSFGSNIIHLAEQYGAMMSYARGEQTVVELGLHGEESFFQLPIPYRMEQKQNGLITEYRLKKEGTDPDIYAIFQRLSFCLCSFNKVTVYQEFEKLGYIHVRDLLWHCYEPINGKPCGQCVTCVPYIREGMYDMFDRDALIRYIQFCDKERKVIDEQYQSMIQKRETALNCNHKIRSFYEQMILDGNTNQYCRKNLQWMQQTGKTISVLFADSIVGQLFETLLQQNQNHVIFSSKKDLKNLTAEEWNACKQADYILDCNIYFRGNRKKDGKTIYHLQSLLQPMKKA